MPRKQQAKWSPNIFRMFLVSLLIIITSGMLYQIYDAMNHPIKTVSAIPGIGNEGLSITAIAIREEQALGLSGKGYTLLARDGKRLDKGAHWAAAFSSQKQISAYRKLQECEALRERLLALQSSTLTGLSAQSLEAEIYDLFLNYLNSTCDGTLTDLPDASDALSEKWGVLSALNSGEIEYVGKKIKALDKEIKNLEDSTKSGKRLKTPAAGIYISTSDGFEDGGTLSDKIAKAHGEKMAGLSVKEIDSLISKKTSSNAQDGGKLVTGFVWYFAANVPARDAQMLSVDSTYAAELEQYERVELMLESIGAEDDGRVPLIFSCTAQDEQLLRLRVTSLRIILKEEEGLRIPREAIRVYEGETGVFVMIGNQVRFRRTLIRCGDEDYVIVRALSTAEIESLGEDVPDRNKSPVALREQQLADEAEAQKKKRPSSVQRYDRVIVEGRDLEKKLAK